MSDTYAVDLFKDAGMPINDDEAREKIISGLPVRACKRILELINIDKRTFSKISGIAPATLARRTSTRQQLKVDESDKVYRLLKITAAAVELFEGDREAALEWIRKPNPGLNNHPPMEMIRTTPGFEMAISFIKRLDHGVMV